MGAIRLRPIRLVHSYGTLRYEARCPECRTLFGGREDDLRTRCRSCGTSIEIEVGDHDLSGGLMSASYLVLDWARR